MKIIFNNNRNYAVLDFNLTGKKSPTSISGVMNCPIVFRKI